MPNSILLLPRTRVQFLEPMQGSSELPAIPAPGVLAFYGLHKHLTPMLYRLPCRQNTHPHDIKINEKNRHLKNLNLEFRKEPKIEPNEDRNQGEV